MQFPIQRFLTRATWLKVHLYLAFSAGFFFVLMGFSGSLSVYREELDELLNPQLVIEEPQGKYQSLDRIMASVRAAHPHRYGSWTLEMPGTPHGMVTAWYDKPDETFFELYAPLMVSVNPYTARPNFRWAKLLLPGFGHCIPARLWVLQALLPGFLSV